MVIVFDMITIECGVFFLKTTEDSDPLYCVKRHRNYLIFEGVKVRQKNRKRSKKSALYSVVSVER